MQVAEHPSIAKVFPSSQKWGLLISAPRASPSPQISLPVSQAQEDARHPVVEGLHSYPASIVQLVLHPSPLMLLPSSQSSFVALRPSPHVDRHTSGADSFEARADVLPQLHLNPHSTVHVDEHPSPSVTPLSSHSSFPTRTPSPHTGVLMLQLDPVQPLKQMHVPSFPRHLPLSLQ